MTRRPAVRTVSHLASMIALALLALPPLARAEGSAPEWISHGPGGGEVAALVIDPASPSTLYVSTRYSNRVWKSTNGGDRWRMASVGLPWQDELVQALAVDPSMDTTVYAGTSSDGVYRTRDGGSTWERAGIELIGRSIQALGIASSRPSTVYAGLSDAGVWRSTDGGNHWARTGAASFNVTALAVDPTDHRVVFAGSSVGGLFRTTDGGATWTRLLPGRGVDPVRAIALSHDDPSVLYVVRGRTGVAKSEDGGTTWVKRDAGIYGSGFTALVISPSDPSTLYVAQAGYHAGKRVFRSVDGAESWVPVGPVNHSMAALAIDPADPGVVYAGGADQFTQFGGVWKTIDAGRYWHRASDGLTGAFVSTLDVDPERPGIVYTGTQDIGAYRSGNGGWSWDAMAPNRLTGEFIQVDVAVDPNDTDTIYAGRFGCCLDPGGFFRSLDRGRTWHQYTTGLPSGVPEVRSITAVPSAPGRVYASVGGIGDSHVYWSQDGGVTWTRRDAGLPALSYDAPIAIDPTAPDLAYAGTCSGLYRTTDAGETWDQLAFDGRCVVALEVAPSDPDVLYANAPGVLRSDDGGAHWKTISHGLPGGYAISFAVDRSDPFRVYAANGNGVFVRDSSGVWSEVGKGFGHHLVFALALDPAGTLYATTTDSGVWSINPGS